MLMPDRLCRNRLKQACWIHAELLKSRHGAETTRLRRPGVDPNHPVADVPYHDRCGAFFSHPVARRRSALRALEATARDDDIHADRELHCEVVFSVKLSRAFSM